MYPHPFTFDNTTHSSDYSLNSGKPQIQQSSNHINPNPSNLTRTSSNLKRQPSNITRQPSNITSNNTRQSSNLTRQSSSLTRYSTNLKRQSTNLTRQSSSLTRQASSKTITSGCCVHDEKLSKPTAREDRMPDWKNSLRGSSTPARNIRVVKEKKERKSYQLGTQASRAKSTEAVTRSESRTRRSSRSISPRRRWQNIKIKLLRFLLSGLAVNQ